jgi:hypothetical protein
MSVRAAGDTSGDSGLPPLSLSRKPSQDNSRVGTKASGADKSASKGVAASEGTGEDDDAVVQEMLVRSRNNVRFNHVRLGEIRIHVSYKGGKSLFGQSFEEQGIKGLELKVSAELACICVAHVCLLFTCAFSLITSSFAPLQLHTLVYTNKTWSVVQLANRLKRDIVVDMLSQVGRNFSNIATFFRDKFQLHHYMVPGGGSSAIASAAADDTTGDAPGMAIASTASSAGVIAGASQPRQPSVSSTSNGAHSAASVSTASVAASASNSTPPLSISSSRIELAKVPLVQVVSSLSISSSSDPAPALSSVSAVPRAMPPLPALAPLGSLDPMVAVGVRVDRPGDKMCAEPAGSIGQAAPGKAGSAAVAKPGGSGGVGAAGVADERRSSVEEGRELVFGAQKPQRSLMGRGIHKIGKRLAKKPVSK